MTSIKEDGDNSSLITWNDLRLIVESNKLSTLRRSPHNLRLYRQWTAETIQKHGSLINYLLAHRLPTHWGTPPFTPQSRTVFENTSDYFILLNDWPYGFTPNIQHMIIWTRTTIPTDSSTGDLTPESRVLIANFVKSHFTNRLGSERDSQVLWFKNWGSALSVADLDHVHVLVRDVEPALVEEWTSR
ncbi:hypothetical protein BKA64DRAFT_674132 [Cadophora sp. MPI-SDFR-AT-0126]|nr:hypothetical protein BKA64DRAFT_674132 [Leotiomycetes sp. MPI-SDFR-AT-0126]